MGFKKDDRLMVLSLRVSISVGNPNSVSRVIFVLITVFSYVDTDDCRMLKKRQSID